MQNTYAVIHERKEKTKHAAFKAPKWINEVAAVAVEADTRPNEFRIF